MEGDNTDFGDTEGGGHMSIEDERIQFLTRCQFNAYCKHAIRNRANELKRNSLKRWENEYHFEDFSPMDQERLQIIEDILNEDVSHYYIDGRIISGETLHEAIDSLPEHKRTVIHLYFFDELSEEEIAKLLNLTQPAVSYRKKSSLNKIKRFLEEHMNGR